MRLPDRKQLGRTLKTALLCITNPRFLLCAGLAWMITNGWAYVLTALGAWLGIGWMTAVGGAYLAFLWLPISPEKIVTVAIAMGLLRWLFPNDEKTLGQLRALYHSAKTKWHETLARFRQRRSVQKQHTPEC